MSEPKCPRGVCIECEGHCMCCPRGDEETCFVCGRPSTRAHQAYCPNVGDGRVEYGPAIIKVRPPERVTEKDFNHVHEMLRVLMSRISEDCYAAGWMTGLEYELWGMLHGDVRPGHLYADEKTQESCRKLAETLGGWIIWVDGDGIPGLPASDWGTVFVPMAEWELMYKKEQADDQT